MKPFVTLGALVASLIASAALAQTSTPADTSVPRTPDNRSGLPKAPPDIVTPGSAARPFTGNDEKQPPTTFPQPKIEPKKPSK